MARFEFRLQSVLDYRNTLVERAQAELAEAQQRLHQEEEALEQLRSAERASLAQQQDAQRRGTLDLPLVTQLMDHLNLLATLMAQHESVIQDRRREVEEYQQRLIALAKDAKGLEKLRQRQEEEFIQDSARRERVESSEVAALQHRRLQWGAR